MPSKKAVESHKRKIIVYWAASPSTRQETSLLSSTSTDHNPPLPHWEHRAGLGLVGHRDSGSDESAGRDSAVDDSVVVVDDSDSVGVVGVMYRLEGVPGGEYQQWWRVSLSVVSWRSASAHVTNDWTRGQKYFGLFWKIIWLINDQIQIIWSRMYAEAAVWSMRWSS